MCQPQDNPYLYCHARLASNLDTQLSEAVDGTRSEWPRTFFNFLFF